LALAERLNKFLWEVDNLSVDEYNLWMAYLYLEQEEAKKSKGKGKKKL